MADRMGTVDYKVVGGIGIEKGICEKIGLADVGINTLSRVELLSG